MNRGLSCSARRAVALVAAVVVLASGIGVARALLVHDDPSTYIVVLRSPSAVPEAVADRHKRLYGAEIDAYYHSAFRGYVGEMRPSEALQVAADPAVASVERDQKVHVAGQVVPTGVDRVAAPDVGSNFAPLPINGIDDARVDVDVAILDTGVDVNHPDLNVVSAVKCMPTCVSGGVDGYGHGTHVGGIVGALDNGIGAVGIAPGARLWSVKVLDDTGSGSLSWIAAGIDWVTAHASQIDVANMSLGCPCSSSAVTTALNNSIAAGVTYIAAAGNSHQDAATFFPANHPGVIAVSAEADFNGVSGGGAAPTCKSDVDDTLADFSNYGSVIDITAPGVCIYSTLPTNPSYFGQNYGFLSGTSMASPHVAGAAALLASTPTYHGNVSAIRNKLLTSGNFNWTDESGDGVKEPLLDVSTFPFVTTGATARPGFSAADITVMEPAPGPPASATFTVVANPPPVGDDTVSVKVATGNGTATAGSDYTAVPSTTLTFTAAQPSRTVSVPVLADDTPETTETFRLNLSSPQGGTISDNQATATIIDPQGPITLSVSDARATEGGTANFNVMLSRPSTLPASVQVATTSGTATAGADFTALPSTVVAFAPGETSHVVSVPISTDDVPESYETFTLNLSTPVGAVIADGAGTATIVDAEGPIEAYIGDVTATEGGHAAFVIRLVPAPAPGQTVSVKVATANGTATAGSDYTALATTTVAFAPGESSHEVDVPVASDGVPEANETFSLKLSSPVGLTLGDNSATATILDPNGPMNLTVNDPWVAEGATGQSPNLAFTLSLSAPPGPGQSVSVNVATANGTAVAGSDYTSVNHAVTFPTGVTTRTVLVPVIGDDTTEPNETVKLNLSSTVGAVLADSSGLGTIVTDDGVPITPPSPSFSVNDPWVIEGGNAVFTVALSAADASSHSVKVATSNGTALSGSDYPALALTTLSFAPGETSKTVVVPANSDSAAESNETFYLNLSAPTAGVIGDAKGTATILDPGGPIGFTVSDAWTPEGTAANFTVGLSAPPATGQSVSVVLSIGGGTATAGEDYTAPASQTLTFAPGETSRVVSVPTTTDGASELNETFNATLSGAVGAVVSDAQGVATIVDAEGPVGIFADNVWRIEGDTAQFVVTLSGPAQSTVTVKAATAGSSATPDVDFTSVSQTLSFAPGETTKIVSVPLLADSAAEALETFNLNLSNPTNATVRDTAALGTIVDPGGPIGISIDDPMAPEGTGSPSTMTFTITLTAAPVVGQTVSVKVATSNGTATAGSDYTAVPLTVVSFSPGQTSRTVSVAITPDNIAELNETFNLNLSVPVGAVVSDSVGVGTIVNDD